VADPDRPFRSDEAFVAAIEDEGAERYRGLRSIADHVILLNERIG